MKKFFAYFIHSYLVTFLLIASLGVYGAFTAFTLPRESAPEIKVPIAIVFTAYPGSSARDVEELVTKPIEDALENLEGLKSLSSTSQLGVSSITVEYNADEDLTESIRTLRETVDTVTDLPSDTERPRVIEINFNDQPIITVGLSGIDDTRLLSLYAQDIADEIETIPNVSQVDVIGERTEQINIRVSPETLRASGVSAGQIAGALRANNINAPFGSIDTGSFGYDLRLVGKFSSIEDVANTPIALAGGAVVPLSSIATVSRDLSEASSESRISVGGEVSTAAVSLQIRKKTGGNIIAIIDSVQEKIAELQSASLPEEVQVSYFADTAEEIRRSLRDVTSSGIQTLIIVFIILWVFLGWREALIASLAVPFTLSIAFIILSFNDITLNGISLFSLILALGLLVDNAIVIIDGIYSKQRTGDLADHAASTVTEFFKPLAAGTLTTVAAFFPMLLVSGIIGEFLRTIPIVLTATLLSSLLTATILLPSVAVRFFQGNREEAEKRWFTVRFNHFSAWYSRMLSRALASRKFQKRFIGTLIILMAIGLSLPFTGLLKTSLFPATNLDFIIGNVELAPGSTKESTALVMAQVEEILRTEPDIKNVVLNTGTSTSFDLGGGSSSESLGSFSINLNKERERTSQEITDALRTKFLSITEGKVTLTEVSAGPPSASPVELRVQGPDLAELDRLSSEIVATLQGIDGAIDADRNLKYSAGQFNFTLNRTALAQHGLSASDVAQTLRILVFGMEATTFLNAEGEEVIVHLAGQEDGVDSISSLLGISIQTPTGETVLLQNLITPALQTSIDTIRHRDTERSVSITANVRQGANANEITATLQEKLASLELPKGYEIIYGGETQETAETFLQLYRSMIIAVALILMIMVIEFNSFRQPFVMFLSIPLALIGVLFGLVILQGELNFAAFIGLVSLTGIVVNNAILLVDRMNSARSEGEALLEAVQNSAASRLRPIMLTTLTTGLGLLPLVWVDEFFRDLALTILTGLAFSTVLTLGLIPILYYRQALKMERKKALQERPAASGT